MDSNDSFSLALDGEGFTGLAGGHHALGPAPGLPHHGGPALGPAPGHAHYPGDHYDQPPPLPPHPVFSNCGENQCWESTMQNHFQSVFTVQVAWMIQQNTTLLLLTPG